MTKPIFTGYDWDVDLIDVLWKHIDKIGKEKFQLDYYQPRFEIVTSQQMLDAYSSIGMPIYYNHWSFGKEYISNEKKYKSGKMNLAYELVINSNPCLAYLMENNTATMTALVIAHANCGHAHFFKNNYLYKQHTNPNEILNFLEYSKKYIRDCEEKYGLFEVESLLDSCHLLQHYGVDKYPKPDELTEEKKLKREENQLENELQIYDHQLDSLPHDRTKSLKNVLRSIYDMLDTNKRGIQFQEENLLKFIYNNTLVLEPWQKEIVNIIQKISQYFYPQSQTKVMNEGFACFIHYHIMKELYDQGKINEGAYIEFLNYHTSVCFQRDWTYINPYALGFEMFMDIKRACLDPDDEDYEYLPTIAGKKDWMHEIKEIVKYFKDESFVLQFLSPKLIRKFKLMSYSDIGDEDYEVLSTHCDDDNTKLIRKHLSEILSMDDHLPNFEVSHLNKVKNTVTIVYKRYKDREINDIELFKYYISHLTGFKVDLIEESK